VLCVFNNLLMVLKKIVFFFFFLLAFIYVSYCIVAPYWFVVYVTSLIGLDIGLSIQFYV
jgi:hypothetical protein